jgi:hypothetical protein
MKITTMKNILFALLLPFAATAQTTPVASIYGGVSNYHLQAGIEAGFSQVITEHISVVAFAHANSIGQPATWTAGVKSFAAMWWLDSDREAFIAPVIALQNRFSHENEGKNVRATTALLGVRYQVYGGFGEVLLQPGYGAFTVGFMFGNRKR